LRATAQYLAINMDFSIDLQELNYKNGIVGIFFDMSRAFDTVDHDILLNKCVSIGIRGTAFDWLKSYLDDQKKKGSL
jgi:hypothetical protein